ncbi:MAG: DNA polymerase III subunit alpha [Calditrichaeota bacterium]|nr:DNA polymerase III subunit alpha [Calditrichota bacterium]RQW08144.1 MAG: DNA polymerase III subunit alpha [Calditrichota bacterium]
MSSFIHLHNHTHYSLLDGAAELRKLLIRAGELKYPALAITDHGNMFGVLDFYLEAKKLGIKPIIGMEAYIAPGSRFEKKSGGSGVKQNSFHLILLAKNRTGYDNLMKLSSLAYTEGFYYRPRIDKEILREYSEGLICATACMKGEIFYKINYMEKSEGIKAIEEYLDIFGEDFYIELQNHNIPEEQGYENLYKVARDMNIPVIATNDVHYLEKEHHTSHDVLLCIQSGKTVSDQNRMRYNTEELYLKSPDEMYTAFPGKADALERTLEIAEKCNMEIETGNILLPRFPLPKEFSKMELDDFLEVEARKGLQNLYPKVSKEIEDRLNHELQIIRKTGYAGYFLIVKDFIDFAKKNDIPVGLGRGSVAGSLVAYATGITRVDPLRYDLLFERFLNPDRVSMPDIDIDFCYERREEVIDYVRKKYGEKNVAQIITFGTMASKGVIRDVARALGIEYAKADAIAKLIPVIQGKPMPLEEALQTVPELKEMDTNGDEQFKKLMKHARVLEGLARHASIHAAGIIIAPDVITNYVPLYQTEEKGQKVVATQFSMTGCETIGLLKMDFLGLRTLTVLHHTVEMLREKGVELDLDELPLDDQPTYEIFCEGNTVGIFQFESAGMQEYLRKLQPNRIEDLIAMNALYRPGPIDNIDPYIARKSGQEKIEYIHPKMEPILRETYGIIVYQEQVMRIASELAGFSLAKADILRKAISKKKLEEMEKLKIEFIAGCQTNNIDEDTAKALYELILRFASYGFNKSHSAAYALLAYQTAYLKRHYPAEFMAATMASEMNDSARISVLIEECRKMNISILPPNINISSDIFKVTSQHQISFALAAIKNVGRAAIRSIIKARTTNGPFKNIFHMMQHVDLRSVNKKILEALVQAGALDELEGSRAQNFAAIELAISFAQKYQSSAQNKSQITMFEVMAEASDGENDDRNYMTYPELPDVPEWLIQETLQREKELLGFYISGHPLDRYAREINLFSTLDWNVQDTYSPQKEVQTGAILTQVKKHLDRKGNIMAFITMEDKTHSFEGVVFSSVYEKYSMYLNKGELIFAKGKVSEAEEKTFRMLCDEIIPLAEVRNRLSNGLQLIVDPHNFKEEKLSELLHLIQHFPGNIPLYFEMRPNGNGSGLVMRSKKFQVILSDEFLDKLQDIMGKKNIHIKI